ncbi:MAG: DUF1631 domain-containing protein [Gammaproteobacteria bacterium]|nr:DUF1631 domain-containing protein [Gammaproteobacteria bacterium]
MQDESRRQLGYCIDQLAQATVARLRAIAEPLLTVLGERATSEASADRRRRLAAIVTRVDQAWKDVVADFDEAYRQRAAVAAGLRGDGRDDDEPSLDELTLVDDDQVEWELAFAGAVMRMKAGGGEALAEAGQRVSSLRGGDADGEADPAGLDVLGKAIQVAIERNFSDTADRRALLVHFEPLFTAEVPAIYSQLNELLAARGVNPALRARTPQRRSGDVAAGAMAAAGLVGADVAAGDFLGMLQRMVGGGAPQAQGGAPGPGGWAGAGGSGAPPGPQAPLLGGGAQAAGMPMAMVPVAMVEALNKLQQLDLSRLGGAEAGLAEAAGATSVSMAAGGNALRELRQQEFVKQLPPVDVATIDVVAMLFDFIFEDHLIPDSVKAIVGRLQIPLLKVAMADKTFFANREHPARLLLDTISQASIAAGKGLDHGHPVFERIKGAVNSVLTEFEQKPDIFETLLADLSALLAEQEQLALDLAERSRHVAEAQERDDLAETWTQRAFDLALQEAGREAVPAHIVDFLERHWTRVLKLAYLKGGAEGHPWALAVGTLNDLLWSVKGKDSTEERQKLIARLPEILRRVNAYLDHVQVDARHKAVFMSALGDIHIGMITSGRRKAGKLREVAVAKSGEPVPAPSLGSKPVVSPPSLASVASEDLPPDVVVTRSTQDDGLEVESIAIAGRVLSSRPVRASEIGNLERGDWVEFVREDGEHHRGRLSWVSPQRGILLFTNPHSSQAISITPEALALQMRRGLAQKLDASEALVDRALGRARMAVGE